MMFAYGILVTLNIVAIVATMWTQAPSPILGALLFVCGMNALGWGEAAFSYKEKK